MEVAPPQGPSDAATTSKAQSSKLETGLSSECKKKVKDSKNNGLRQCFSALVNRKQVHLELEVVQLMLRKELNIKLNLLDPVLAGSLPYLLVYYIKNWPGWQKSVEYYSGKITFKTWYDKFLKFVTFKLNDVINNRYTEAVEELSGDELNAYKKRYTLKKVADGNTQTDNLAPKSESPVCIHITAKPDLLNTIVFTDTPEGDIIMKQHVLDWNRVMLDSMTLKQLITWPHVGVHFTSPVFSFRRKNVHEFRRFISLVGTGVPPTPVDFIEKIETIKTENTNKRMAYTLGYLKELCMEFLDALKTVYTSKEVLKAYETVIDEFLADVTEIEIQRNGHSTFASATSVLFNIGKSTYFRNKKLSKTPPTRYDVGYTEVIIPRMETVLEHVATDIKIDDYINHLCSFNPENSPTSGKFELPQITFSCNFCRENFNDTSEMMKHLTIEHNLDQPMLCTHCKHSFPAFNLASVRWKHMCSATASKE